MGSENAEMKNVSRSPVARRQQRQHLAAMRKEVASGRTPQQQLARLDKAFGNGVGAKKERAKLAKRIAESK